MDRLRNYYALTQAQQRSIKKWLMPEDDPDTLEFEVTEHVEWFDITVYKDDFIICYIHLTGDTPRYYTPN